MTTKYALVSLPLQAFDTGDKSECIDTLRGTISSDNGNVVPFQVPEFKIGTLDALVQQADDLTKLSNTAEAVAVKVGDALRTILGGDEQRLAQYKMVNDSRWHSTYEGHRMDC